MPKPFICFSKKSVFHYDCKQKLDLIGLYFFLSAKSFIFFLSLILLEYLVASLEGKKDIFRLSDSISSLSAGMFMTVSEWVFWPKEDCTLHLIVIWVVTRLGITRVDFPHSRPWSWKALWFLTTFTQHGPYTCQVCDPSIKLPSLGYRVYEQYPWFLPSDLCWLKMTIALLQKSKGHRLSLGHPYAKHEVMWLQAYRNISGLPSQRYLVYKMFSLFELPWPHITFDLYKYEACSCTQYGALIC